MENLVSNIEKRSLVTGDQTPHPRVCDLVAVVPSVTGKVELVYEGEQEGPGLVAFNLIGRAIKEVFQRHFPPPPKSDAPIGNSPYSEVLKYFSAGQTVDLSDESAFDEYSSALNKIPGLKNLVQEHFPSKSKEETATKMEMVLEGLHQYNLIGKETFENAFRYTDMLATMLRGMED
jgi:magnesium chelatase subunit I